MPSGFVGQVKNGNLTFDDCVNAGPISIEGTFNSVYPGGFVSEFEFYSPSVTFNRCANTADITNNATNSYGQRFSAGGFIGRNQYANPNMTFNQCYNSGAISASAAAAGFCSSAGWGTWRFTDCYNIGSATIGGAGGSASGFIGAAKGKSYFTNCYNAGALGAADGVDASACTIAAFETSPVKGHEITVENSYWNSEAVPLAVAPVSTEYGAALNDLFTGGKTATDMQTADFAATLGSSFTSDLFSANGGYPVLKTSLPSLADCQIAAVRDQVYTGAPIEPALRVFTVATGKTVELTQGRDFGVFYSDNIDVGTATATLYGRGTWSGETSTQFTIGKAKISSCTIAPVADQVAGSVPCTPALMIANAAGRPLTAGTDYSVVYSNNDTPGIGHVLVVGKGNYEGFSSVDFNIAAGTIEDATLTGVEGYYDFTGAAVEIVPVLTKNGVVLEAGKLFIYKISFNSRQGVTTILTPYANDRQR